MQGTIYNYVRKVTTKEGVIIGYQVIKSKTYYSFRYSKCISIKLTDKYYDGATGAKDINSFSWLFHDVLCRDGTFDDKTTCTNWQASVVMRDILQEENRWFRANSWFLATWLFGGGKARKNGMF